MVKHCYGVCVLDHPVGLEVDCHDASCNQRSAQFCIAGSRQTRSAHGQDTGHCLIYMLPLSIWLSCLHVYAFPPAHLCLAELTELSVLLSCHVKVSMSE